MASTYSRPAVAACCAAAIASGCAGDGEGLDENGRPLGQGEQTLQPTFSSIQTNVFTPICAPCHAGAAAPLGFRLDEGAAYAMLVNAPSVEAPSVLRVAPGNPDASYLVQKIEGTATVGARMPLNGPPLPAETIAVIRQWIADGAAAAAQELSPPALTAVWPIENALMSAPPREILLSASSELDASLLEAGVVTLRASGGDGDFSDGDERILRHRLEIRSLAPSVFALVPDEADWASDRYELRASGGAPLALADRGARVIDGDRDGAPGGDYILRFTVETPR